MSSFDYQTLLAAREALRREIAKDSQRHPARDGSAYSQAPDSLMRDYGLLAKLDAEIAQAESQSLRTWASSREGVC